MKDFKLSTFLMHVGAIIVAVMLLEQIAKLRGKAGAGLHASVGVGAGVGADAGNGNGNGAGILPEVGQNETPEPPAVISRRVVMA